MKVLIIDDNKELTYLFTKVIEKAGHECTVSNSGRSGLALLLEQAFDATILDMQIPDFSGIQIINALEKSGKLKERKIVILTASSISDEKLEELKRRGVHACLRKPIKSEPLLKILEEPVVRHE